LVPEKAVEGGRGGAQSKGMIYDQLCVQHISACSNSKFRGRRKRIEGRGEEGKIEIHVDLH
jgi:hypothetical protein